MPHTLHTLKKFNSILQHAYTYPCSHTQSSTTNAKLYIEFIHIHIHNWCLYKIVKTYSTSQLPAANLTLKFIVKIPIKHYWAIGFLLHLHFNTM